MERVWFITGASRGFGRAFTEEAVKRGDKVIATVRRVPHDDIFKHPSVLTVVMDVTKTDEVEKAIKDGMDRFGRIDVLINNAGFGFSGAFEETTDEDLRNLFETDYFGVVNVTRRVIPLMRKAGKGVILNVSSQGGLMGFKREQRVLRRKIRRRRSVRCLAGRAWRIWHCCVCCLPRFFPDRFQKQAFL